MKQLKKFITLTALTITVLALTACPKKGNDNNNNIIGPVFQNCANCGNINQGYEFFRSVSQDYTRTLALNLSFFGTAVQNQNYYYNTNSPVISYYGPVGVSGQMNVQFPLNLGYCAIPAGNYSVYTLSAGQWSNSIISQLVMQASGAAHITMRFTSAQVSAKSYGQQGYTWNEVQQSGRLFGDLYVESVNGYPCQRSVLVD